MLSHKSDIITRLRREILPLEGLHAPKNNAISDPGLGFMAESFPQGMFPLGAVHELISEKRESAASTAGFVAGILSRLMKTGSAAIWIGRSWDFISTCTQSIWYRAGPDHFYRTSKRKRHAMVSGRSAKMRGPRSRDRRDTRTQFYFVQKISASSGTKPGHRFYSSFKPP